MSTLTLARPAVRTRQTAALATTIFRGQPYHKGHASIIHGALEQADHLLVNLGSAGQARSYRNPWTFDERKTMILNSLRAEEVGRVTILPLRDHPYNDEMWFGSVQTAVRETAAKLEIEQINKKTVVLAGHAKDGTSYYLKRFPQYGAIRLPHVPEHDGTSMREHLFAQGGMVWLHGEGRKKLPSSTVDFLDRFGPTDAYEEMFEEYRFIREYRQKWASSPFPPFFNTVDTVLVQSGHVLMIRRKDFPGRGLWALPGGYIKPHEEILDAAIRETREETRLKVPAKILRGSIKAERTFAAPYRDPRGRTITHGFLIHLPPDELPDVRGASDALEAAMRPIAEVREEECFSDHYHIIHTLLGMLKD